MAAHGIHSEVQASQKSKYGGTRKIQQQNLLKSQIVVESTFYFFAFHLE